MNASVKCINVSKSFSTESSSKILLKWLLQKLQYFGLVSSSLLQSSRVKVLQDITFELSPGDSFGIVGANGAGKSTLLQILSGTLEPTTGIVSIRGKVCSLLELGSGFNPEFTGLENVRLGCALMNIPYKKNKKIINKILNFSGIGEFSQQPLKYYSTGMAMRLAFSVIVFSDPEILIIDEALAVGDISFSQKCVSYLQNFRKNGILIVTSHDTTLLKVLCSQSIWINGGHIIEKGSTKIITERYHSFMIDKSDSEKNYIKNTSNIDSTTMTNEEVLTSNNPAELLTVQLYNCETNKLVTSITSLEQFKAYIQISLLINDVIKKPIVGFYIRNYLGLNLFGSNTTLSLDLQEENLNEQKVNVRFNFEMPLLEEGEYTITIALSDGTQQDHQVLFWVHEAYKFSSHCKTPTGLVGIKIEQISVNLSDN